MTAVQRIKNWLPPRMLRWARRVSGRSLRFSGFPQSWLQATELSTGYLDGTILARVAEATRQVVAGKAAYERDSVTFKTPDYPFPLLASLLHAAALNQGQLDVIDFGGSLGSTYRQCRPFLRGLAKVRWQVIEQSNFVELGRREFQTDELTFHRTVGELPPIPVGKRILLLSSVLQYLECPFTVLSELRQLPLSHIVIDRTPFSERKESRLCVQEVPAIIYKASYPCWILSRRHLLLTLSDCWTEMCTFQCVDGQWSTDDGLEFEFRGFLFVPKAPT